MQNKSEQLLINLDDLLDKSMYKIQEQTNQIIQKLQGIFHKFSRQFKEHLKRELNLISQISSEDLQFSMEKLKEQLRLKFSKFEELDEYITRFSVNPGFVVVDPLMKIPRLTDLNLRVTIGDPDSPLVSKKIKSKRPPTIYQCPKCPMKYNKGIFEFRQHLSMTHNIILKFQCPYCEFNVDEYVKLTPHLFDLHSQPLEQTNSNVLSNQARTYICKFTKQKFTSKQLLQYQIKDNKGYYRYM